MKAKRHTYGNASQVTDHMADGGIVKGAKPGNAKQHKGTSSTKNMADGGKAKAYGAPMGPTPKPGGTTRVRPKVGDKDPNYKPKKPSNRKPASSSPAKKKKPSASAFRNYRGVDGAVEGAQRGKRK